MRLLRLPYAILLMILVTAVAVPRARWSWATLTDWLGECRAWLWEDEPPSEPSDHGDHLGRDGVMMRWGPLR